MESLINSPIKGQRTTAMQKSLTGTTAHSLFREICRGKPVSPTHYQGQIRGIKRVKQHQRAWSLLELLVPRTKKWEEWISNSMLANRNSATIKARAKKDIERPRTNPPTPHAQTNLA